MGPGKRVGSRALATALLLGIGAGCGNLTAGGHAETEVVVTGDEAAATETAAPAKTPSGVASDGSASPEGAPALQSLAFQGNVTVDLEVFLETASGDLIGVTETLQTATVSTRGTSPATIATVAVPPGSYHAVHVIFTSVEVDLVDPPPPFGTTVSVAFSDEEDVRVEQVGPISLDEDDRFIVLVDLRTSGWLQEFALDVINQTIRTDHFENAVRLSVRVE